MPRRNRLKEFKPESLLAQVRHVALDMDGTIYSGGTLFPFTLPFLERLKELGIGHTFLTNNSSKSSADYLAKLNKIGIPATADQLFTSTQATIEFLQNEPFPVRRVFLLGTPSLAEEISAAGFVLTADDPADEPDALQHEEQHVHLGGDGPKVASVIGGLGGSEVRPEHFQLMFNLAGNIAEGKPYRPEPYWLDIEEDPIFVEREGGTLPRRVEIRLAPRIQHRQDRRLVRHREVLHLVDERALGDAAAREEGPQVVEAHQPAVEPGREGVGLRGGQQEVGGGGRLLERGAGDGVEPSSAGSGGGRAVPDQGGARSRLDPRQRGTRHGRRDDAQV